MLVLCSGSREVFDPEQARSLIAQRLEQLPKGTTIMHGHAQKGVDSWVDGIAYALGFEVNRYPADWTLGKHAGHVRNELMLDLRPDLVLAFWNGSSPGTKGVIKGAKKRGIELEVFYLVSQPLLLDIREAEKRRDAAIERAYVGAQPEWRTAASWAIYTVALQQPFLNGDEVWASGLPKPDEPRALGPMMTKAEKAGIIRYLGNRRSESVTRHRGFQGNWQSLIFGQNGDDPQGKLL